MPPAQPSDAAEDAHVRPAVAADSARIAEMQLELWARCYARLLPPGALHGLKQAEMSRSWAESIQEPPTPAHQVLVAVSGSDLAGFAAVAPAADPDRQGAAELATLVVDPSQMRQGHGSRLLAGAVRAMKQAGAGAGVCWLLAADTAQRSFLESAGWAADGSRRDLDMGSLVEQLRLHTDLRAE